MPYEWKSRKGVGREEAKMWQHGREGIGSFSSSLSLLFPFLFFFFFFIFFIPNLNLSLNFSARLTPEEKQQQPLAGSIFRVKNLGTTGSPAVAFHGWIHESCFTHEKEYKWGFHKFFKPFERDEGVLGKFFFITTESVSYQKKFVHESTKCI